MFRFFFMITFILVGVMVLSTYLRAETNGAPLVTSMTGNVKCYPAKEAIAEYTNEYALTERTMLGPLVGDPLTMVILMQSADHKEYLVAVLHAGGTMCNILHSDPPRAKAN